MGFERDRLPDPVGYFEGLGLKLTGPSRAKWRTTACTFHGGSDSMRINTQNGAWVCMAGCGAKGGDVLAYHMQAHGLDFITAARELGAWVDDGQPPPTTSPKTLSARDALSVLTFEAMLIAVEGSRMAEGIAPTQADITRVRAAAHRILVIAEDYA